jgi:type IV pilus assembly protein PilP
MKQRTPTFATRLLRALRLALPAAAALALSGCASDVSDLDAYMNEVRARPAPSIEPIPPMPVFDTFRYPELGLRDPFVEPRPEVAPQADGPRPDPNRPRELLEEFALDSLRMMGTLERERILWGLVRDTRGRVHRVQLGNYIGQNHGEIVGISDRGINLRELVSDGDGGWIVREAALAARE